MGTDTFPEKINVKISLSPAVEAQKFVRGRGSHIF
jgi:hypothetical protein